MFANKAATVDEYLAQLPADRRTAIARVRDVVLRHLPDGYQEMIGWGAITYAIPLEVYPHTYNKQPLCIAALASTKNHCSLYLMGAYGDTATRAFVEAGFKKHGKKLDMGKSCIRFRSPDDLPLDVVGAVVARISPAQYVTIYEASRRK
jgi:uncharacterized protein YdhG (YjbR/CyaY superfamily)